MLNKLPPHIKKISQVFTDKGFQIYLVGGSVRDLLLKKEVTDWDFTTDATPEQILSLFPDGFYDNAFGTVGIPLEDEAGNKQVVEITTFRTEGSYTDNRHPESVSWGKTILEDLSRRDFTINALALSMDNQIIDPYNGQQDLSDSLIRAVGEANIRFKEDALRLMRAVRLATQLSFQIESKTLLAISKDSALLNNVSKERIHDELLKILSSSHPDEGILLLKNTDLLQYILPELLEGIGVSQERPGRHHTTDVFTHNLNSLKYCPSVNPIVRFATLIHDVGKPRVAASDQDGLVIFHNHEIVGAKISREICDRLRFSKKDREKIITLIRWHMFTVDEHITDSAVRRFIRRIGVDNVRDMIDVRIGDRLGSGTQTAESWRLKLFKKRLEEQLSPAPFSINDLAVDGNDLMQELKLKPGKIIGTLLKQLFEETDEDLNKNNKEYLLKRAQEIFNSSK